MTKIAVVIFIVIFVLNLLPAFAPPTWTAMSFIGLTIPSISFVSLAVVAATAATLGRITLAKLSRAIVRQRLLSEQTRCNVDAIRHGIEGPPVTTFGTFLAHWLVVNIPPEVTELALDAGNPKTGKLPQEALQTLTDFGAPGYGGPCPPPGDHPHRYLFTVFAVGTERLPVNADTSAAVIGFQLNFNTLAKTAIMGLYKR